MNKALLLVGLTLSLTSSPAKASPSEGFVGCWAMNISRNSAASLKVIRDSVGTYHGQIKMDGQTSDVTLVVEYDNQLNWCELHGTSNGGNIMVRLASQKQRDRTGCIQQTFTYAPNPSTFINDWFITLYDGSVGTRHNFYPSSFFEISCNSF